MTNLRPSESQLRATVDAKQAHSNLSKSKRLGEKIWTFGKGREKKPTRAEAKPPKVMERTASTPTPEREALATHGWEAKAHPGGQVSYQEVTTLAVLKPSLSEQEMKLLVMIAQDYQAAQAVKVSSRPYTGQPYAAAIGADAAIIKQGQRANRSDFMQRHMSRHVDLWWLLIRMVVLGAHYARLGRPLTPAEISGMILQAKGAGLELSGTLAVKLTVLRAQEAYHAWLETQPMKIIEPQTDGMKAMAAERALLKRLEKPKLKMNGR
jgi:hypothetical protein